MRKVSINGLPILILVVSALGYVGSLQGMDCHEIAPEKKQEVKQYIAKRHHVSTEEIDILRLEIANASCYQEIGYTVRGRPQTNTMYLAPDGMYLIPVLYDVTTDPSIQEDRHRAVTHQLLTAGVHPTRGDKNSVVTIVEFSDFQCPFCKKQSEVLRELPPEVSGRIKVVFRHYPLPMHPWAMLASQVSVCAAARGPQAFWDVHDFLFSHQTELTSDNLVVRVKQESLRKLGIDDAAMDSCISSPQTAETVMGDKGLGDRVGVRATPTMFINGQLVAGLKTQAELLELIRAAEAKAALTQVDRHDSSLVDSSYHSRPLASGQNGARPEFCR